MTSSLVAITEDLAVTLNEFIEHAKLNDDSSQYPVWEIYLKSATDQSSQYIRRAILASDWIAKMRSFSDEAFDVLPVDLNSVEVSYYDSDNALQVLPVDNYELINNGPDDYATIEFKGSLPAVYDRSDAVIIEYSAGYGSAGIPNGVKLGILMYASTYLENRQNEIIGSITAPISFGGQQVLFPYKMLG